jgi:hypothetical protein
MRQFYVLRKRRINLLNRVLCLAFFVFFFSIRVLADYSIPSGVTVDASTLQNGLIYNGKLFISGTLEVTGKGIELLNFTEITIKDGGQILWSVNPSDLTLAEGTSIFMEDGALGLQPEDATGSRRLLIGKGNVFAISNGKGQGILFSEFNGTKGLPFTMDGTVPKCLSNSFVVTITPFNESKTYKGVWTAVWKNQVKNDPRGIITIAPDFVSDQFNTPQSITISFTTPGIEDTIIVSCELYYYKIDDKLQPIYTKTIKVPIRASGTWVGNTSDWNTANNWCGGIVPLSTTNVNIPAGTAHDPVISNALAKANKIDIDQGASLTITDQILEIHGDVNADGNLDATEGSVNFTGSSTQYVYGWMFKNRTIKNMIVSRTDLRVSDISNDTLNITGKISFGVANAKLYSGDNITLKSTKERTASLGTVGTGNIITGKFTVERYINVGTDDKQHGKKWLFLATPTQGQTIKESWMENGNDASTGYGAMLSGPQGFPAWDRSSPAPSIKYYNETTNLWRGAATSSDQLYNPNGWMVFVRGDRSVDGQTITTANPTNLRSKGTLLIGNQSFVVPADPTNSGFFSIGNPYASDVDMRKVTSSLDDPVFYIWNPYFGGEYGLGAYQTFIYLDGQYRTVPGDTIMNYILSGQAFFVQRDTTGKTITFTESAKGDTSANTTFFRPMGQKSEPTQMLRSNIYNDLGLIDGTLHIFGKDFSNKVDYQDARKMMNSGINLSIKVDNKLLVVERRQPFNLEDTIFYNLTGAAVGKYNFAFEPNNLAAPGLEAWLEDAYTKERTSVDLDGTTEVNFEVTKDAASKAADRFRMVFKVSPQPASFLNIDAVNDAKDVDVKWEVKQEIRVEKYVVMTSTDGTHFTDLAEVKADGTNSYVAVHKNPSDGYNYYRVRSIDIFGVESYSAVAKVFVGSAEPSLTVFPNPVANGVVHLRLKNYPAGKYLVRLINPAGQVMLVKVFDHAGGNYTEKIPWSYKMAHGDYHLEVRHPDGSVKVIVVRW